MSLTDDDWQEEHKRLAELDERDERDGLAMGLGLGGPGIGAESDPGGSEDPSSRHLPPPSSFPSLKFSSSSSRLPPSGQ